MPVSPSQRITPETYRLRFCVGQLSLKQGADLVGCAAQAYVELPKQRVDSADFVEAHLVNELFENDWIIGKEVDAPLPVVETDRAGNDLPNFTGIAAADEAMLVHLAGPLFDREAVPVLGLTALAIHRVEARIAVGRDCGKKARAHGFFLAGEGFSDLAIPIFRMRLDASID